MYMRVNIKIKWKSHESIAYKCDYGNKVTCQQVYNKEKMTFKV